MSVIICYMSEIMTRYVSIGILKAFARDSYIRVSPDHLEQTVFLEIQSCVDFEITMVGCIYIADLAIASH